MSSKARKPRRSKRDTAAAAATGEISVIPEETRPRLTASERQRRVNARKSKKQKQVEEQNTDEQNAEHNIDEQNVEQNIEEQNIEEHNIVEEQQTNVIVGTSSTRPNTLTTYGGPKITDIISSYDTHIASSIWSGKERETLMCVNHGTKILKWEIPDNAKIFRGYLESSGLYTIFETCYSTINKYLISAFVERWHPESNTFHLPFGEMTITLDDIASLLHIPVEGLPIQTFDHPKNEMIDLVVKNLGVSEEEIKEIMKDSVGYKITFTKLYEIFDGVCDEWEAEKIKYAARAYLLFLIGNTLFVDKSKSHVSVQYLKQLANLDEIRNYSWGSAALCWLYRQLGLASRIEVKQIGGYLGLLESWIYEHFLNLHPSTKFYKESSPRAARWDPANDYRYSVKPLRIYLDNIQEHEVIFDPYIYAREFHPFPQIAWYSSCLLCLNVVEPYHPTRVLRQFGRVQNIPRPIIPSRSKKRGATSTTYKVLYDFVENLWNEWQNHCISEKYRSIPLIGSDVTVTTDYFEWYIPRTVVKVHPGNEQQHQRNTLPSYDHLYTSYEELHNVLDEGVTLASSRPEGSHLSHLGRIRKALTKARKICARFVKKDA